MKLSNFKELINEAMEIAHKDNTVPLNDDPDIIFSMGKPTDNELLQADGMGVAGTPDGKTSFFIAFSPAVSPLEDVKKMMRELLGEETANEIIAKVKAEGNA